MAWSKALVWQMCCPNASCSRESPSVGFAEFPYLTGFVSTEMFFQGFGLDFFFEVSLVEMKWESHMKGFMLWLVPCSL